MKNLDIELFCELARNTINSFDHCGKTCEALDLEYYQEEGEVIEDFRPVIYNYCNYLVREVFYEQADFISSERTDDLLFNPIEKIELLLKENYNIELTEKFEYSSASYEEDYLDMYVEYVEFIEENYDYIFTTMIDEAAEEMLEILYNDAEFVEHVKGYF